MAKTGRIVEIEDTFASITSGADIRHWLVPAVDKTKRLVSINYMTLFRTTLRREITIRRFFLQE